MHTSMSVSTFIFSSSTGSILPKCSCLFHEFCCYGWWGFLFCFFLLSFNLAFVFVSCSPCHSYQIKIKSGYLIFIVPESYSLLKWPIFIHFLVSYLFFKSIMLPFLLYAMVLTEITNDPGPCLIKPNRSLFQLSLWQY